MKRTSPSRKRLLILLAVAFATALTPVVVLLAAAALVDAGYFHGPLLRLIESRTGRDIQVSGPLETHLLSRHPQVTAAQVTIGNPPWVPAGPTAEVRELVVKFDLPFLDASFGVHQLELNGAALHLLRDQKGRANWQWHEPGGPAGKGVTLIRRLSMREAQVELDDERRHLQFKGVVSAQDAAAANAKPSLRIEASGQLNKRAVHLVINGDPLPTVTRRSPYHFDFDERSSGSRLTGRGSITHPFDMRNLETGFEATGADLKDLYFLTGVTLPNTGNYSLSGSFIRHDRSFTFADLAARSGQSDMSGSLTIDTSSGHSKMTGTLYSNRLRLSDLGLRAAGRDPTPPDAKQVFANTAIPLRGIRRADTVIDYHARVVDVSRLALKTVAMKVTIKQGALMAAPLSAVLADGHVSGFAKFDATHDVPTGSVDLKLTDMQLAQLPHKDATQAPLGGLLRARLAMTGHGDSPHELASKANGTITAVLPHGTIRKSLAELAGMDFRGLGLLLAKNDGQTDVRCGVANFQARDGLLSATSLVIDTEPALIEGSGAINLQTEDVDLSFRGHPKHPRLRLRAPLLVQGTLGHPSLGLKAGDSAVQAGEAVALGVLFTPLAAVLAFVDPGLASDADCQALIAQTAAQQQKAPPQPSPPPQPRLRSNHR